MAAASVAPSVVGDEGQTCSLSDKRGDGRSGNLCLAGFELRICGNLCLLDIYGVVWMLNAVYQGTALDA